ncbi:MAG: PASTA domain-containing protein [Clostridia bacterium]|nr:PASTA domain-containing protein [Clostridia bacterium]
MSYVSTNSRKRILIIMVGCIALAVALLARLAYIQIIKSDYYSQKAYTQQTRSKTVEPKRGTIYDTTGERILAQSISTNIVTAVPNSVPKDKKEEIAQTFAQILGKDKEELLKKLQKNVSSVTLATKVDQDEATQLLEYINENDITGISIDEDMLRIYPYGTLLSHVLGFVGTDNQGLAGIEAYYEDDLAGTPGKIVASFDGSGRETPFTQEQYIAAENGKDIVLTIDASIQSIVEKYLSKAVQENIAEYGSIIIMRPSTGEVLAMANYPTFDSNDPFTPNTEELKANWENMTTTEKSNALNQMWRNRAISDTQEPGSTFKLITAAAALEENIVNIDDKVFQCSGSMQIGSWTIKCWRYYNPHGNESLREGIMNSCNPVFMQVSQRMGIAKYMEYIRAFNLNSKTGIDLPGEATGIMHNEATMGEVDLATTSFGQTIQITSLQTAVNYCAVANGGYLVEPYIVREIKSGSGNYDEQIESKVLKQVMSEQTASDIMSALVDTVNIGTGKSAKISDYQIAGKTATGENGRGENLKYLAGFVGIAPASNPEIVVVMNLYDPKGPSGHGGATLCGPVVGSIIDEVLKYMDVQTDYTVNETESNEIVIPNVVGKTYTEAQQIMNESGFGIITSSEFAGDTVITNQVPKYGASLEAGATVMLYKDGDESQKIPVPDVRNLSSAEAVQAFKNAGLNVRVEGTGFVLTQDVTPNEYIEKGSIVTIKCVDDLSELP